MPEDTTDDIITDDKLNEIFAETGRALASLHSFCMLYDEQHSSVKAQANLALSLTILADLVAAEAKESKVD